jgi:hypothetical protein
MNELDFLYFPLHSKFHSKQFPNRLLPHIILPEMAIIPITRHRVSLPLLLPNLRSLLEEIQHQEAQGVVGVVINNNTNKLEESPTTTEQAP